MPITPLETTPTTEPRNTLVSLVLASLIEAHRPARTSLIPIEIADTYLGIGLVPSIIPRPSPRARHRGPPSRPFADTGDALRPGPAASGPCLAVRPQRKTIDSRHADTCSPNPLPHSPLTVHPAAGS
ncbi:hypothetical protein [Nocardia lijiangensis]|uniref:hypothetical protein n=1 Tax=Nocardia lijiangensis TaxID=299618 RepID=UPI003D70784C